MKKGKVRKGRKRIAWSVGFSLLLVILLLEPNANQTSSPILIRASWPIFPLPITLSNQGKYVPLFIKTDWPKRKCGQNKFINISWNTIGSLTCWGKVSSYCLCLSACQARWAWDLGRGKQQNLLGGLINY